MKLVTLATMIIFPLSLTVMGCGDACDDAADKFEECYPDLPTGDDDDDDADCTGNVECLAECVNDASCDDITAIPPGESYSTCVVDCG
jgi:hypothetical protein